MPKRCPLCNKSSADIRFYGEFCEDCVKKKLLDKLPEEISLTVCKRCGMIKAKGAFKEQTTEAVDEALAQELRNYTIRLADIVDEDTMNLDITEVRPEYSITVEKKMPIKWKRSMCERCNRIAGSYYEAVIQLRGTNMEKMEKFIDKITKYFERKNEFITRVREADNGLDVYLSNKKLTSAYLSRNNIQAVTSYTLYGLRQGKKVYRHTYAVRI